jgi:hypothetical protein
MSANIDLDSSGDDLDLPPPTNNAQQQHKDPISLDSDEEEDELPPPPASNNNNNAKAISLDDSDEDDLPPVSTAGTTTARSLLPSTGAAIAPAPSNGTKQQQQQPPVASSVTPARATTTTTNTNAVASSPLPPSSPASANLEAATRARAPTMKRRAIADVAMEGFLFKQSPTWPYVMQKRWVTLKGRVLSYYEEKASTAPSGTIDLKGAQIIDSPQNAKAPHALGITGDTPSIKGRTFYFAAGSREEYLGWLELLKFVTIEPKNSEIHWFEKMAQGLF